MITLFFLVCDNCSNFWYLLLIVKLVASAILGVLFFGSLEQHAAVVVHFCIFLPFVIVILLFCEFSLFTVHFENVFFITHGIADLIF